MYNISNREKILLSITISFVITALFYNLIVEPLISRWRAFNGQIESKKALLNKNKRLLAAYKILEEEYIKYPVVLGGKNEEEEIARALGEIENVSKKSSCYIVNLKPRASKKIGNYKEISFDVTTEGSIDEFTRFMYEVETSKKMLRIRRFTITSKTGPSAKLKCVFLISKIILS